MKSLFVISNGYTGFSYVRVYAWVDNPRQALKLAKKQYDKQQETPITDLQIKRLFTASAETFVTEPSSEGFSIMGDCPTITVIFDE